MLATFNMFQQCLLKVWPLAMDPVIRALATDVIIRVVLGNPDYQCNSRNNAELYCACTHPSCTNVMLYPPSKST